MTSSTTARVDLVNELGAWAIVSRVLLDRAGTAMARVTLAMADAESDEDRHALWAAWGYGDALDALVEVRDELDRLLALVDV